MEPDVATDYAAEVMTITVKNKAGVSTAPERIAGSDDCTDIGTCPEVSALKESSGNTPTANILSYDGVATTCDNCTTVVGRSPLSICDRSSLLESGICYCVGTGTLE